MNSYKLKLTALTPIHIGTGEVYEPTNFVIDDGYLYEFDEKEFYNKLDTKQKENFLEAVEAKTSDSLFEIHRVIKNNKQHAIASVISKVQISKGIENDYHHKVGKVVQNEGGRNVQKSKVFNRFQIERTARLANTHQVYIPASSIKGAISTAYQEAIFKQDYKKLDEFFYNRQPQENIFKNLMIADTKPLKTFAIIGYSLNKERFEDENLGPSNKIETLYKGSQFETILQIRDYKTKHSIDFDFIKRSCDEHYYTLFQSIMRGKNIHKGQKIDDYINEYFSDNFYDTYKNFKLKENQFLIRVGKHSGARAVTIDGKREIKVKISGEGPRRKPNRWETLEEETTTWLFGATEQSKTTLVPFGWVLCEVIS